MAVGVTVMLFVKDSGSFYHWAEWTNQHPQGLPLWPVMFITIACGALSGFHATQSPLMARCMGNEKQGRLRILRSHDRRRASSAWCGPRWA